MNVNAIVDLEIILCQYTSQHLYLCFYRVLTCTFDFLMASFGNSKSYQFITDRTNQLLNISVKFFEGSNVAECTTFKIKLFTFTAHNLSICYVIFHISLEGEFSSKESYVLVLGHSSSFTFKNSINVTFFFI